MELVIGVDGGNTKTLILAADLTGQIRGYSRMGSSNWEILGLEGASRVIRNGVDEALGVAGADLSAVKGIHLGLAGMDWPEDRPRLLAALSWLKPVSKIALENDSYLGVRANTPDGFGICVSAGTGVCACITLDGGEGFCYGGFADMGGGIDIDAKVFQAVLRAEDGRGDATAMTPALLGMIGFKTTRDLVYSCCRDGYRVPGSVCRLVLFASAAQGDRVATGIVKNFGRELALCATNLIKRYRLENEAVPVVASGSLLTRTGSLLYDTFCAIVRETAPRAKLIPGEKPPVAGAVRAALREYIDPNPLVDETIVRTLPGDEWFRTDDRRNSDG
ncbi:MAG: N-acetylglucosamine kinase [Bacillota bacterium]